MHVSTFFRFFSVLEQLVRCSPRFLKMSSCAGDDTSSKNSSSESLLHESDVRKCKKMGKRSVEFVLTKEEIEYLEESKRRFDLPSAGKAMRRLINYLAQENPKIMTRDHQDSETGSNVTFKLATSQIEWLESLGSDRTERNDLFRRYLNLARKLGEQSSIFAKIRCESKTRAMIRVLCIRPGFGGGRAGTRYKILENIQHVSVKMPDIPEPVPSEMERGLSILRAEIKSFRPHILLVGSRGGIFAKQLVEDVDAMFLMGALETRDLCSAKSGNLPLLMVCILFVVHESSSLFHISSNISYLFKYFTPCRTRRFMVQKMIATQSIVYVVTVARVTLRSLLSLTMSMI